MSQRILLGSLVGPIRCSGGSMMLVITLMIGLPAVAQPGPFNDLPVPAVDSTGRYTILIGGHFHGQSTNRSGYPAATLLANLDTINALGADIFLSMGDLFMDPAGDLQRYKHSLFDRLSMPLFNVPGNHDVGRNAVPEDGEFPYAFMAGGVQVVLLNTEENNGSLSPSDLELLEKVRMEAATGIFHSVMILSHRPVWAETDPQYGPLFPDNTRSLLSPNFQEEVFPVLEGISQHLPVYWISGSMGGLGSSSIFFQEHAPNLTYIQCALRDEPHDALLIADVQVDTILWRSLSLTGQKLSAPETYNAEWWRSHGRKEKPFNWRLLPYLTRITVTHPAFWWGMAAMLLLGFGFRRLVRRG